MNLEERVLVQKDQKFVMPNRNDFEANPLNSIENDDSRNDQKVSDQRLLANIQKGDKHAFGILYERYLELIYNYIYFKVSGNHHETEDLTEEVFLRAFASIMEKSTKQANFKALLYRIAHNLVIDNYRAKKIEVDINDFEIASGKSPNPEQSLENVQLSKELADAIKTLKPKLQEVIILRYISDLGTEEIAEVMGISRNYVRVLQYRALQTLKDNL
jgi:RNA polymerase sigma-70 factor (ECF subfamily)